MACTPFIWIHYHFNTFEGHETLRHARLAGRVTLQCGDDRRTKGCLGPALRSDQPPESMVSAMFLLEHLNDLRMGEKVAIVLDGDITGLTSGQIPRRVGGDGSLCVLSRMLTLTLAGRRFSRQDRSCVGFGTGGKHGACLEGGGTLRHRRADGAEVAQGRQRPVLSLAPEPIGAVEHRTHLCRPRLLLNLFDGLEFAQVMRPAEGVGVYMV
jgi:hypothetical protein